MILLRTTVSMRAALTSDLDPALKTLLALRMGQLGRDYEGDFADLVQFLVVQPGDTLAAISVELGFSILENLVDRTPFGDPEFTPSFEWIQADRGWFELVYVLSDSGSGVVVFVQDQPGVEPDLLALCSEYASPG